MFVLSQLKLKKNSDVCKMPDNISGSEGQMVSAWTNLCYRPYVNECNAMLQ